MNAEDGSVYIALFFEFSECSVPWELAFIDVTLRKTPAAFVFSTLFLNEQNGACAADYGGNANIAIHTVHGSFCEEVRIKDCFDSHTI